LIDAYSGAACIPPKLGTGAEPSRQWDSTLRLADGRSVVVSAFQAPSGAVRVHYTDSGSDVVAADAGEYVYPSDIRWDPAKGSLYVKAHGVPVLWDKEETDLFEFDLPSKRHGQHEVVDPTVLQRNAKGDSRTGAAEQGMKLTKPVNFGASQLIPGVVRTRVAGVKTTSVGTFGQIESYVARLLSPDKCRKALAFFTVTRDRGFVFQNHVGELELTFDVEWRETSGPRGGDPILLCRAWNSAVAQLPCGQRGRPRRHSRSELPGEGRRR
jgi:hypothetical protein